MIPRQPLKPNNRIAVTPKSEFIKAAFDKAPTEKASIRLWARRGRQTSEGFGGGNRITN